MVLFANQYKVGQIGIYEAQFIPKHWFNNNDFPDKLDKCDKMIKTMLNFVLFPRLLQLVFAWDDQDSCHELKAVVVMGLLL